MPGREVVEAAMESFGDRYAEKAWTSRGLAFSSGFKNAVLLIALFCAVGTLLLFGEGLASVFGRYEPTPLEFVGP
jgi:hypothetical protein